MKYICKSIMVSILFIASIQAIEKSVSSQQDNLVVQNFPLHTVILNSNYSTFQQLAMLEQLLKNQSIDIDARDRDGKTALNLAVYYKKDPAIIQFLIKKNAKIDEPDVFNVTPLSNAIRFGQIDAARMLLVAGADPEYKDDEGYTPLDLAARTEETKAILGLQN